MKATMPRAIDAAAWKSQDFDLVAFDGEIVSVVEEIDPFAVPLWHGRLSPLFSKSASLHFFSLVARGLYGGQECWAPYYQDLEHLLRLFEQRRLRPVKMENLGNLSKATLPTATHILKRVWSRGSWFLRWVNTVSIRLVSNTS